MNKFVSVMLVCFLMFSCASRKKVVYFQNSNVIGNESLSFETKLQKDDLLMIHVSAKDSESVQPFNLELLIVPTAAGVGGQRQQQLYIVDDNGMIDFPVLGKLKLEGLTRSETIKLLTDELSVYIQEPVINLRIINFKVSVLGEVNKPGVLKVVSERITILEALSQAGDLTIYGKRDNLLLIREVDGVKKSIKINLTKADFINSEYYYLKQNDIIYVEPNSTKINSSAVGTNTTVIISSISLLLTALAIIINLNK